jgi:ankyrin repeat protein
MRHKLQTTLSSISNTQKERQPIFSNPYDHLPVDNEGGEDCIEEKKESDDSDETNTDFYHDSANRKMPSGCVGAYSRAIHNSAHHVKAIIKKSRRARFNALSEEEKRQLSLDFLAACTSNDSLEHVKEMIRTIEPNDFFLGNDGSETCALHTAAFHGADQVVEFLCSGIDDTDPQRDGGFCDVNCKDSNGWTALHFAAGANSVAVVRALVSHGAALDVEAHNGYSPKAWAVRLSNEEVAEELTDLQAKAGVDHGAWMSSQPLTSIANRFFALIPSH